jgi:small subunit ribosomal protein S8
MSMNDLLSDFITRVKNAKLAQKDSVNVKKNKVVLNSTKLLTKLGYFKSFEESGSDILIYINESRISDIKRVSKPGRRLYFSYKKLPVITRGIGYNILSTSKGLKTNSEAKQEMLGGELIFQIW